MLRKNGFTLIEMLVVLGILGIIAVVGVATYNRMNMKSQVEMEAKRVASLLRGWQKDADSGTGADSCPVGISYGGVRVTFDPTPVAPNPDLIQAEYVCVGGTTTYVIFDTVELMNQVLISSGVPIQFLFRSVGGGSIPIQVTLTKGGIGYEVSLTTAGGISVTKVP